jgi:hypothetical protein
MHGGKRQGAGRKKGTPAKKTQEIAAKAYEKGITPLEVMLETMRDHWEGGRKGEACLIAKDAAPYMHPRLQAIQGGDADKPIRTVGELTWLESSAFE